MDRGDTDNRIVSAPMRTVVRAVGVMAAAAILATAVASDAVAQTPPSPTAAPSALPRSFLTPDVAKPAFKTPAKQAKSCSSYGDGFVNVPGTDTCIKAGGYLSTEVGGHR
jgi:Porin subfamily